MLLVVCKKKLEMKYIPATIIHKNWNKKLNKINYNDNVFTET